ncbi:MAG: paraquat-inducible protein A [Bacteroidetes bacterium]|nr:paraquat-inducible protein A [Bacteroidota bacterium]
MDKIRYIVGLILLAGCIHILVTSFMLSRDHQELKYDLALINDARYGLFNVDAWKAEIKTVLLHEVAEFELQGDNRETIRVQLEKMLHTLVDEVEQNLKDMDGFFNKLKGLLTGVVVNFDKIRSNIPGYADAILDDLEDDANMEALKESLQANIDQWIVVSASDTLNSPVLMTLAIYDCASVHACNEKLETEIQFIHERLWIYTGIAMAFALIIWLMLFFSEAGNLQLYVLSGTSIVLLAGGLALPMLDLQAGMESIQFTIMGETIAFEKQVLFFQSKSILDVIVTLFTSKSFNGVLVGILILLFSVLFPVSKLVASFIHIYNPETGRNKLTHFLVFKSGKWSMADVFVVALFMAYLGFSGLINSQLANLPQNENFHSISFNASVFQSGFTWFIAFTLSGLFLSLAIERGIHGKD